MFIDPCRNGHLSSRSYRNGKGKRICRDCRLSTLQRYRATESGKVVSRATNVKSLKNLRSRVLEFLGGKCVQCGIDDWRVLQVDHVNGGGRREVRSLGGCTYSFWRRVFKFPAEYQILCANCNWIKVYEKGEV